MLMPRSAPRIGPFWPNEWPDLRKGVSKPILKSSWSVVANRRKYITATVKPVDLGSDGSNPGSQPIVYLSVRSNDAATVFATNKGTGGNFSITGALALAATSPSD